MLSISLKPVGCADWHDVCSDEPRGGAAGKLRYACRVLNRARDRVKVESLYITESERKVSPRRRNVRLSPELLTALAAHQADFSYGVFSSVYSYSRYAVDSFYVLRFRKDYAQLFREIITGMKNEYEFKVEMAEYGKMPYLLFDAHENGLEYFIEQVASKVQNPGRKSLFRLDYLTNSPWCWVDLDPETVKNIVHLKGVLDIEIHRKMQRPLRGRNGEFWKHALMMARRWFPSGGGE